MAKINYSGKANPELLAQVKDIAWNQRQTFSSLMEGLMEAYVKKVKPAKKIISK